MTATAKETTLREMHVCPTCGGAGRVSVFPHEHEWRFGKSICGDGWGQVIWVCTYDGCDAQICSDCHAVGLERCPVAAAGPV